MYLSYTVPFSLSLPFCHSPQFSVIFILYIYSNTFFSSHFSDFCGEVAVTAAADIMHVKEG